MDHIEGMAVSQRSGLSPPIPAPDRTIVTECIDVEIGLVTTFSTYPEATPIAAGDGTV